MITDNPHIPASSLAPPPSASDSRQPPASRERILEAAAAEFAARGKCGVRMEHVAERAGCNKALVYRYFSNRETLFRAVLQRMFGEREETLEQVPKDLASALEHWFRHTVEARDFLKLLMREALNEDGEELAEEERRRTYYREQIGRLIAEQQDDQITLDLDPAALFLGLLALITFPGAFPQITRLVTGEAADSVAFSRRWVGFLRDLAGKLGVQEAS